MDFVSTRLVTEDMKRLVGFYAEVTGLAPNWRSGEFAEFATPTGALAICSKRVMDMFGAGAARPADNHTAIIEFRVGDVDGEFAKLEDSSAEIVLRPTTQPWGNRSLLFRDPDGNLINFFTPVSADAVRKFGG